MSELQYGRIPGVRKALNKVATEDNPENKLVRNKVTEDEIAEVVSKWTGIQ